MGLVMNNYNEKFDDLLMNMKVIKSKEKCRKLRDRLETYYSLEDIEQAMLIGEILSLLDDLC